MELYYANNSPRATQPFVGRLRQQFSTKRGT
jgi:hypothetical protein